MSLLIIFTILTKLCFYYLFDAEFFCVKTYVFIYISAEIIGYSYKNSNKNAHILLKSV